MKAWLERWKQARRVTLFEKWLDDPKSGFRTVVHNRAMNLAFVMVMNWLDRKHLIHCKVCPATESLKKIRERYWCPTHADGAQKIEKESPKEAVAA